MNICFFVGNINQAGGTERVTTVIANELQCRGYSVHILSLQCGDKPFFEVANNIQIGQLFSAEGRGLLRLPMTVLKLRNYLKVNQIDILIDVESMLSIYAIPAVVGLNLHHICWEHFNYNVDLGKTSRRFARKLAALFSDDVVTLTEHDRQLWLANTTCKSNITAIPNPVTTPAHTTINPHKEKLFLAVGRLTYQKGFDLLLQAWRQVVNVHPDWRLRIVGDGEDKKMLEQLRHDLNIEASTEILPKTNNIVTHYQEAAFFVMSSRFEGLPLVLIEAQAYGLPIISFDCETGPAEIVKHGETGWLCEPDSNFLLSDEMVNAANIFQTPVYERLSENAVLNSNRFTLDNIISLWIKLLSRV
ncbi:glycosyltransferase family 4 protein [Aeromonas caviae]|jgi:glycosyltransferase involved in cell wall biosynthesis|uniref:glycosyltransferase family 4 protein n=1 Tax=Aeromonas caviae TaxID=648 RepID=UPI00244C8066|nr:glycosyltransferase family 4 protein [Aeromonas caviae]MDH0026907.1 glycosyltransferase family 4 protein [Aeromonas caviae]MDH1080402.1 glycosyltransferase family 4 protein [Aeromonas caviae]